MLNTLPRISPTMKRDKLEPRKGWRRQNFALRDDTVNLRFTQAMMPCNLADGPTLQAFKAHLAVSDTALSSGHVQ